MPTLSDRPWYPKYRGEEVVYFDLSRVGLGGQTRGNRLPIGNLYVSISSDRAMNARHASNNYDRWTPFVRVYDTLEPRHRFKHLSSRLRSQT